MNASPTIRFDIFDVPARAVDEGDRELDDASVDTDEPVGHLHLERVPLGLNRRIVDPSQGVGGIGAEPSVASLTARPSTPAAYRLPQRESTRRLARPVERARPRHIARTDRQIGAMLDVGDQGGDHRRVVGEVGVHLHDDVASTFHRPPEALPIGGTDPSFALTTNNVKVADLVDERLGEVRSAVGTGVVDDDDAAHRQCRTDAPHQVRHILRLVVRRHHHDYTHGFRAYGTGRVAPVHEPAPMSALPSPAARALAFVVVLIGGLAGGLIGYGLVSVQCEGDCGVPLGLGVLIGAMSPPLA